MCRKLAVFWLIVILLLPLPIKPLSPHIYNENDLPNETLPIAADEEVAAAPLTISPQKYHNIPILMYHVLEDYSGTYEELYVSPQVFRQQLAYLKEEGYHTVKLQDVLEHWQNNKPLPEKPIVLSFDDGYRSMYTTAYPILKDFDYQGVFFLYNSKIDTDSGLSKEMVEEMVAGGMEIGSHTLSHPDMTKISAAKLKKELEDSQRLLSELVGSPVLTLAYPAGRYNEKVIKATEEAGYLAAVTTEYGSASINQNPLRLKRVRINKSDGLKGFIKKIQATKPS